MILDAGLFGARDLPKHAWQSAHAADDVPDGDGVDGGSKVLREELGEELLAGREAGFDGVEECLLEQVISSGKTETNFQRRLRLSWLGECEHERRQDVRNGPHTVSFEGLETMSAHR